MRLTAKQREILTVLCKGNVCPDSGVKESDLDLDQLMDQLSYNPSKQALQFSIRYLIQKGMIEKDVREKRRGRSRRVLGITELADKIINQRMIFGAAINISDESIVFEGF